MFRLLLTMLLAGMAGGTAWGIRGQYGHESGAAIAGILVGFTLIVLYGRTLSPLHAARAVAMFALGISIGGSMTYGQTVGLTHDGPLVGNVEAFRWGMLGLAIKGGVWIGLGGAFFGMGLGGKRYSAGQLFLLLAGMIAAYFLGVHFLNQPFDPANKLLPEIYFSDDWYWEPDVDRPRPECWGGLVAAFALLLIYLSAIKRDWMGFAFGCWGLLGGALGFPAGQCVQAANAWHGDWIASLPTSEYTAHFNWWNMMETTFGFVMGAVVGIGCWFHRERIRYGTESEAEQHSVRLSPIVELALVLFHVRLLVAWNFQSYDALDFMDNHSLFMVVLPMIAVMTGRYWPFLVSLPVIMVPIAGKTVRQLMFGENEVPAIENASWFVEWFGETSPAGQTGWDFYMVGPLVMATLVAAFFALKAKERSYAARWYASVGLVVAAWTYFYLNNAFFHSPWPWKEWTGRTANGTFFCVSAICLTLAAIICSPLFQSDYDERDSDAP